MNKSMSESKIITRDETLNELKDIAGQLSLKYLYSLLGCARGLIKAQSDNPQV